MFRTKVVVMVALLGFCLNAHAQSENSLEKKVMAVSKVAEWAVIPIGREPASKGQLFYITGSGFLINNDGYFVTAAHVLAGFGPQNPDGLTAMLRVPGPGEGSSGYQFRVIEENTREDIALCKINKFDLQKQIKPIPGIPVRIRPPWYAALEVSKKPARMGRFVLVAGYPLTSETPTMQFGNVAGTGISSLLQTLYAPDRFQVSVAVSPGNSGGPVIDLDTGRVVGLIVEGDFPRGQNVLGLGIADPAAWIQHLLEKHHIESHFIAPRALH